MKGAALGQSLNLDRVFYSGFVDYADAVTWEAMGSLRSEWGKHEGFDVVARSHADRMLRYSYTHWLAAALDYGPGSA